MRRAVRAWPISTYLLVLAITTSLPVVACAAFLAHHFVAEASQLSKAEYEDRLRLMRKATELRVTNIIEDMQVLALSPSLSDGRFAEFREHAMQSVKLIGGVAIVLYAPDGQQLVNTRLDSGAPLPKRTDFDVERRAIQTGLPQLSGLQKAVVDGQPIVTIAVPVRIEGEFRYALNIGLSPKYLSTLMDDYISPGLVGSIMDAKGYLLARRPLLEGGELVGHPTIPEVMAHVGEPSAWWIKAVSRTGIPTYTSMLRSPQSGWTINLAVPRNVIDGPLHRTLVSIAGLTLLVFASATALAHMIAKRFLAEFAGLEQYAVRLQADVVEPEAGAIAEFNRMKKVLHNVGRELAESLKQQKALLDEVNHRVKNTLGTVQSIARLSRGNSQNLEQYAAAFEQRLLALAEAYNLLTENNWVGAKLEVLVKQTLAPFAGSERLEISGPDIMLAPRVALAMSASIQELSTNAAKYGAFSTLSGKLKVSWTLEKNGFVRLTWTETNGPPVRKPDRRGFGTRMISSIFNTEAGWSVDLDFDAGGLRCNMQFQPHDEPRGEVKLMAAAS